ncbi:MAG: carbohydrate-binding protein, partial [Dysgonamonadaceae bacterium]|nr:carbohydrate-binding protein [Dysgonamonadaceae bacterium]
KWGFLKPVNHTEQDYSEGTIAVTQTMVDELKAKVNALGYPAPDAHLEYITDNTVSLYKSKPPITAGTVSKSGSTVTLSNWKNVAAFEVCDSSDKIVSVSSGSTTGFSLSTGGKLYAVPYSGARQQVAAN